MARALSEQVVVITGASSGIGRAAALALAARGARVVAAARGEQGLTTLVEQIRERGGTAVAAPTDVADEDSVRALADLAERTFGRVDTWVNGVAVGVYGRVEDVTAAEFERVMRVNFLGHVHGVHAALPALRRAGGGALIGISSVEGVRAMPLQAPYSASKFAVRALYDSLRVELAQDGTPVTVTTILPAAIDTPFFGHARSRLGAAAKPPPPVYAPEVVADSIVYAAGHPRREIPVGGAAALFVLGQRLSPALVDAILAIPRIGVGLQRADRPEHAVDNVDTSAGGAGRVHGEHPGPVLQDSVFTRLIGRRSRPAELLLEVVRRFNQVSPPAPASRPPAGAPATAREQPAA